VTSLIILSIGAILPLYSLRYTILILCSAFLKPATMLRNGASRLALRSIGAPASRPATSLRTTPTKQWTTQFSSLASRRPQLAQVAALKPIRSSIIRHKVSDAQKKDEGRYSKEEIKPTPETVSATSSVRSMTGEVGVEKQPKKDSGDVTSGLKHDVVRTHTSMAFRTRD
jgi:hypothetical protein